MYCPNCGKENTEGAKFCKYCGTSLVSGQSSAPNSPQSNPSVQQTEGTENPTPPKDSRKKLRNRIIIIIVICAAAVVAILFGWRSAQARQYQNHMDAGQAFLEEESYEEAAAEFSEAIEVSPNVVEPYQQLAQAYIGLDDPVMADETYDDARAMIVDAYDPDRDESLLDGSEDLYLDAIDFYLQQGEDDKAEEVSNEFEEIETDPYLLEDFNDKKDQFVIDHENTVDQDIIGKELDETQLPVLLDLFYGWGGDDSNEPVEYETLDPADVYYLAARAIICSDYADLFGNGESPTEYTYLDGDMHTYDDLTDEQKANSQGFYLYLPPEVYEEYLNNLFGPGYSLDNYISEDNPQPIIRRDQDGNFYILYAEARHDAFLFESVEKISESQTEDGAYAVLAKYRNIDAEDAGGDTYIAYTLFWLRPDEESEYGCIVTDEAPAGYNEINDSVIQYFESLDGEGTFEVEEQTEADASAETEAAPAENTTQSAYQQVIDQYASDSPGVYSYAYYDINSDGKDEMLVARNSTCVQICAFNGQDAVKLISDDMVAGFSEYNVEIYQNGAIQVWCAIDDTYIIRETYYVINSDGCSLSETGRCGNSEAAPDVTYTELPGQDMDVYDGAPKDVKGIMKDFEEEMRGGTDEVILNWIAI